MLHQVSAEGFNLLRVKLDFIVLGGLCMILACKHLMLKNSSLWYPTNACGKISTLLS